MKYKLVSSELSILFWGLNNIFGNTIAKNENVNLLKTEWQKLVYLAEFHNFKPILFQLFNDKKLETPINPDLINYTRDLIVNNLFSSTEFVNISNLLNDRTLNYLPYKGHVFLEKLFSGKQLRAIGDLDILVLPQNAKQTLEILVEYGYNFFDAFPKSKYTNSELIEIAPQTFGMNEISLIKTINGKNIFIDFHWGFHYPFLPYQIDLELLFENKSTVVINGQTNNSPSDFANFVMLIIHHGGRECWLNLKYLADLMGFMKNFSNKIDWEKMVIQLETMRLKRPTLVGFFLLQEYFEYKLPDIIKNQFSPNKINRKLSEPIIDYWENCYDILSLKGRLKYERILWSIQDNGFSKLTYLEEMFKMYTIPNPIESKRLITFSDNYYLLNGLSKIITYFWKRGIGKIKK